MNIKKISCSHNISEIAEGQTFEIENGIGDLYLKLKKDSAYNVCNLSKNSIEDLPETTKAIVKSHELKVNE